MFWKFPFDVTRSQNKWNLVTSTIILKSIFIFKKCYFLKSPRYQQQDLSKVLTYTSSSFKILYNQMSFMATSKINVKNACLVCDRLPWDISFTNSTGLFRETLCHRLHQGWFTTSWVITLKQFRIPLRHPAPSPHIAIPRYATRGRQCTNHKNLPSLCAISVLFFKVWGFLMCRYDDKSKSMNKREGTTKRISLSEHEKRKSTTTQLVQHLFSKHLWLFLIITDMIEVFWNMTRAIHSKIIDSQILRLKERCFTVGNHREKSCIFLPCGLCKQGYRWPWQEQQCQQWGWCPLERQSGSPAATESSFSGSKASSPRTCSRTDWWWKTGESHGAARGGKSTAILLTRVGMALVPEVVQVGYLLHAEPAEFAAAHGTGHVITAPIVHFDNVGAAARARLDVISWRETKAFTY